MMHWEAMLQFIEGTPEHDYAKEQEALSNRFDGLVGTENTKENTNEKTTVSA